MCCHQQRAGQVHESEESGEYPEQDEAPLR